MTRREVIRNLEGLKMASRAHAAVSDNPAYKKAEEALNLAIAALRGPTREQVEKARGEWISDLTGQKVDAEINEDGLLEDNDGVHCSVCGGWLTASDEYCCAARFCPHCGSPMTDEAVDIVMKRLEALKDEID